ncbi:MAG: FAD binding domain-containing protein [Blautia wexlerae]
MQFRNCATVGGSICGRYGFSDVLTMFLGMDTWVELHNAGKISLTEFVDRKKDNDILVNIIVKKQPLRTCYYESEKYKDRLSGADLLQFL